MSTIRTNDLYLEVKDFDNVSFSVEDFMVSKNQPYNDKDAEDLKVKISSNDDKTEWKFTIEAGRHKTKEVATAFKTAMKESNACIAHHSNDKFPKELNFMVVGTLKLRKGLSVYSISDFVIAQGSNSYSENNWWIGSPKLHKIVDIDTEFFHAVDFALLTGMLKRSMKVKENEENGTNESSEDKIGLMQLIAFYTSTGNRFKCKHINIEI